MGGGLYPNGFVTMNDIQSMFSEEEELDRQKQPSMEEQYKYIIVTLFEMWVDSEKRHDKNSQRIFQNLVRRYPKLAKLLISNGMLKLDHQFYKKELGE